MRTSWCGPSAEMTRLGRASPECRFTFDIAGRVVGHASVVMLGAATDRYVDVVAWVAVRLNAAAAASVVGIDGVPPTAPGGRPESTTRRHVLAWSGVSAAPAHAVFWLARVSQMRSSGIGWNSPGTSPEPPGAA